MYSLLLTAMALVTSDKYVTSIPHWSMYSEILFDSVTVLNVCTRMPHFATRATLLSTEILKSKGMYAEAAAQLIKMTSEVNELTFYLSKQAFLYINPH